MTSSEAQKPDQVEYQDPGYGNLARVPSDVAILVCSKLGFRIKFIEEGGEDVLLEPVQAGVIQYPPSKVIPKPVPPHHHPLKNT